MTTQFQFAQKRAHPILAEQPAWIRWGAFRLSYINPNLESML